mmetsp:Transcript_953/g.2822  ORF Transcript_953/g.2822 Transcript_953/m.2822 type:complete len:363 (+) Transcript_953:48-1136(+)
MQQIDMRAQHRTRANPLPARCSLRSSHHGAAAAAAAGLGASLAAGGDRVSYTPMKDELSTVIDAAFVLINVLEPERPMDTSTSSSGMRVWCRLHCGRCSTRSQCAQNAFSHCSQRTADDVMPSSWFMQNFNLSAFSFRALIELSTWAITASSMQIRHAATDHSVSEWADSPASTRPIDVVRIAHDASCNATFHASPYSPDDILRKSSSTRFAVCASIALWGMWMAEKEVSAKDTMRTSSGTSSGAPWSSRVIALIRRTRSCPMRAESTSETGDFFISPLRSLGEDVFMTVSTVASAIDRASREPTHTKDTSWSKNIGHPLTVSSPASVANEICTMRRRWASMVLAATSGTPPSKSETSSPSQ